jgi:hypothetical protein
MIRRSGAPFGAKLAILRYRDINSGLWAGQYRLGAHKPEEYLSLDQFGAREAFIARLVQRLASTRHGGRGLLIGSRQGPCALAHCNWKFIRLNAET